MYSVLFLFLMAGAALAWPHHHDCIRCGYAMSKHHRLACCNKGYNKDNCCTVYVIPNTPAYANQFQTPALQGNYNPPFGSGGYPGPNPGPDFTLIQTQYNQQFQQQIHNQFSQLGAGGLNSQRAIEGIQEPDRAIEGIQEPDRAIEEIQEPEKTKTETEPKDPEIKDYDYRNDQPISQRALSTESHQDGKYKDIDFTFPLDDQNWETADGLNARKLA